MREIKFRVWDNVHKEWLQYKKWPVGWQCPIDKPPKLIKNYMYVSKDGSTFNELQHCINSPRFNVVQYIGFKDKNSKEIYERDLMCFEDFYIGDYKQVGGIAEVKYIDDGYGLYLENGDYVCCVWDAVKNYNAKIIGNIYESPHQ